MSAETCKTKMEMGADHVFSYVDETEEFHGNLKSGRGVGGVPVFGSSKYKAEFCIKICSSWDRCFTSYIEEEDCLGRREARSTDGRD